MTSSMKSTLSSVIFGISKALVFMDTECVFTVFIGLFTVVQPLASIAIINFLGWTELSLTSNGNSISSRKLPLKSTGTLRLVFPSTNMVMSGSPLNVAAGSFILQ